jgi:transcriptional regulator with XRE-family HTH domain
MTVEEFKEGLNALGWNMSDFSRATGVGRSTVSRWSTTEDGEPVPMWASHYLGLLIEIKRLHDAYVVHPANRKSAEDKDPTTPPSEPSRAAAERLGAALAFKPEPNEDSNL